MNNDNFERIKLNGKMPVESKIKKKVALEWLEYFVELRPYAQNKLYKVVGPFVVGIEIIPMRGVPEYRPHFALYRLYESGITDLLGFPPVYYEFRDKRGSQFDIPYNDVREKYKEARQCAAEQIPISLTGNVTMNSILNLINEQLSSNLVKIHSGKLAELYQLMVFAALYVNDTVQISQILSIIDRESQKWDLKLFVVWHGNFDDWRRGLDEKVRQRDAFLELIRSNLQDSKVQKLIHSELIQ